MKNRRGVGLVAVAALVLGAFVALLVRSGPLAPVAVTAADVEMAALENAVFGVGTVEARRSYVVGPTAAGRVRRVLVDVGNLVAAGDLLAEMDPIELDERRAAAAAALERARHAAAAADAQVRDAEARDALARSNLDRYAALGERAFFSAAAVETKRQEAASAHAGTASARAQRDAARLDLARLESELAAIDKQRANMLLHAPGGGIVTARDAEPGTTLVAGQGVVRLVDPASVWVRTRIDQGRSGALATGQQAEIVLRSRPHAPAQGRVARMELNGDAVTEERIVQVAFDRIPESFSLGELAEVTISTTATEPAPVIPAAAVRRSRDGASAWRIEDGRARAVPVRVGETSLDGRVAVLSGLRAGDTIVVHSERELRADDGIRVVDSLEDPRR